MKQKNWRTIHKISGDGYSAEVIGCADRWDWIVIFDEEHFVVGFDSETKLDAELAIKAVVALVQAALAIQMAADDEVRRNYKFRAFQGQTIPT